MSTFNIKRELVMIDLKTLKWPDNWLDFVDLLSKTVLAATVAIVGFVYSHYKEIDDHRAAAAAQARESLADQRDAIGLFVAVMPNAQTDPRAAQKLGFLSAYCEEAEVMPRLSPPSWWGRLVTGIKSFAKPPPTRPAAPPKDDGGSQHKVTGALCTEVRSFGQVFTAKTSGAAGDKAAAALEKGTPLAYVQSDAAAQFNAGSMAAEAGAPATSSAWYAVIASIPLDRPNLVPPLVAALNAKLVKANLPPQDAKVYKTVLSRNFAITSGGVKTEREAKARAALLRLNGIPDAFAQPDRGWSRADEFR